MAYWPAKRQDERMFHKVTPARAENDQGAFLQGMQRDWSLFFDGSRYFKIGTEGARSPETGFYVAVDAIALCDEHGVAATHQESVTLEDCFRIKSAVEEAYSALKTRVVFSETLQCNGSTMPKTILNG